jgi:hypothetical protein
MKEKLELRMYGLVPYNISSIQKGIQFGHGVVEYGQLIKDTPMEDLYNDWANNWKTFIILNGGTTNNSNNYVGTLNNHAKFLSNIIPIATFYEPDLGNQLTAIVFIVDERIFNFEKWPDMRIDESYESYVNAIGGEKMMQLREYLKQFKLA